MFEFSSSLFFLVIFLISFIRDKRKISNAIFFLFFLSSLFLNVMTYTYHHNLHNAHTILVIIFFSIIPIIFCFALFMIYNGFVILKKEGKSFSNSLSLLFGLSILGYFVVSFLVIMFNRHVYDINPKLATIIYYTYLTLSVLFVILFFIFIAFLIYTILYVTLPKNKDYDFIIIHGSGLINGDKVPPLLASRIDKGIEAFYAAKKNSVKLIASGGKGSDECISEGEAIYRYLIEQGIDKTDIIIENQSTTTYENLKFSHELAKKEVSQPKYLFVSNNYHVFRVSLYAKRLGLIGEGVGSKTAGYYIPSAFIREYVAILKKLKWGLIGIFGLYIIVLIFSIIG